MLLSRLRLAFAVLIVLSAVQLAFTVWAVQAVSTHAALTRDAQALLNSYLELGGNKQRLLVWLAGTALTGAGSSELRDQLLQAMDGSLRHIEQTAPSAMAKPLPGGQTGAPPVELLRANFAAMQGLLHTLPLRWQGATQGQQWLEAVAAFDQHGGRDMRVVLAQAVEQQRYATAWAMQQQAQAMQTLRWASLVLLVLSLIWGVLALRYFMLHLHRPLRALFEFTQALAAGDYNERAIASSQDEFERIGQQFNALARQLHTNRRQSHELRNGLDWAVAERTQALMRSHEALLQVDAQRQRFLAEISHELRTPVTVIRGEAEIALRNRQLSPAEYRSALERIVLAAGALSERVQELMRMARAQTPAQRYELVPTPLGALLNGACQQIRAIANNRGLHLKPQFDAHASSVAMADPDKLQQALIIVLDNAVRYSKPGQEVQITAETLEGNACVRIRDQGIGIDPAQLEHVFEPYVRTDKARHHCPEGLGLGLSIARAIVAAHRGSITLESQPDCGTCVSVMLPLAEPVRSAEPARTPFPTRTPDCEPGLHADSDC